MQSADSESVKRDRCVIIGAGPAGLTAAYELSRMIVPSLVVEQDDIVGGISRTVNYKGYRCDIGGHRFFSKVAAIRRIWRELLPDDLLLRPRLSRIYYNNRFFDYPLNMLNALKGLGIVESCRIMASYAGARLLPSFKEDNFEQWVSNRFGKRLFNTFFKTYTEKVWGVPCAEISADWARQRIRNLDVAAALKNALMGSQTRGNSVVTSLIDRFYYPRLGPGMMWEACRDRLVARGVETRLNSTVVRVRHEKGTVTSVTVRDKEGREQVETGSYFLSSMPIRTLMNILDPPPPANVVAAANRLRYRDFLTVMLIVDTPDAFPDNWIYVHSPEVKVGRIQNFKNWSPEMVPDQSKTSLGLEYFVQEGDELWNLHDGQLIDLGRRECARLGLIQADKVIDGTVIRMPKAYPVYDPHYDESLYVIRVWLDRITNLQLIGRNGQHRYNNQDHSMLTGLLAARHVYGEFVDIWDVNVEEAYHEDIVDEWAPDGSEGITEEMIRYAFARYDPLALGVSIGIIAGVILFLASSVLLLRGFETPDPLLAFLSNYLIGYRVSWLGALTGAVEAAFGGFAFGYILAKAVNLEVNWSESMFRRKVEIARTMT